MADKNEARQEMLEEFSDSELNKQTLKNIFDWACDGKSDKEIAKFMSLTKKEFEEMKAKYPEIIGVMAKGEVYANTQLALSMYELAVGGKTMYKQVLATETIYDDYGKKVKTVQKPITIKYQLEPNFYAQKFLMEHKEPKTFGSEKREEKQNEVVEEVGQMDKNDLYKLRASIMKDDLVKVKGGKN